MTSQASRPNPYVGPRAFQDGETLYGRDREVKKLLNLLIAERIVLLYSPSGAGKTSLVQAALMPELREEGFRVMPVIRVGLEPAPDLELPATTNRYILSTLLSLEEGLPPEQQIALAELADMDFTAYLDRRLTGDDEADGDVLIFDQFEEILTVDPTAQNAKTAFFAQLGQALRRPRNRWALFAMREEYPAGLDPYLRPIPTRFSTTFRLELLGVKAARQAMQEPARQAGMPFTDTAAVKLTDDLRRVQVQQPDGTISERSGTSIEPVQLQVVCYRLWENLPDGATEIRETDIREAGDVDSALAGYYADRVKTIAENTGVRERTIREWFDRQLITEQGIRGQVLRGLEQSQRLENRAIEPLVDAHLVRAENRRGATWYELAHDRLIEPVKEDNADWREKHLSPLQRQAALWESQNRSKGHLLRDDALVAAEAWAKSHDDELISIERDFLNACREARTERRKNRFIQGLALAILIIAYIFNSQAEVHRKEAERLSLISIAQTLATPTSRKQGELGVLLAYQANLFTQRSMERYRVFSGDRFNQQSRSRILEQIDNTLRITLSSPYSNHTIRGHKGDVWSVAFSPDGQTLASGSEDGTVRLWDLRHPAAKPIVLSEHESFVRSVAFSPDGRMLASGSEDDTVRLWDLENPTAKPIVLCGHVDSVWSVAFSPDGQTLASGGEDSTVRLWDLINPTAEPLILHGHEDAVWSVVFSPDGKRLASGSRDSTVRLWDLTNPTTEPVVLYGHKYAVWSVAFSPDGKRLASGGWDSTVRLWDLINPTAEPLILHGHEDAVWSVAFSPDGKTLISGSLDATVRLWDLRHSTAKPTILRGHKHWVWSVAFSPDGKRLALGSEDDAVWLWDLSPPYPRDLVILHGHEDAVRSMVFSPDGQILASGSEDSTVRLWDLTNPTAEPLILHGHEDAVRSVAFSPDGQTLASGSEDSTVRLWDLSNPATEPLVLHAHEDRIYSVAFSPDGQTLVSGSEDGTVRQWDLTNPTSNSTVLCEHESDFYFYSVAFSPDGQTLALGSPNGTVQLRDLQYPTAEPLILRGHGDRVWSVMFSPDGERLASGIGNGTVWLWSLHSSNPNLEIILEERKDAVSSVSFSLDGKRLATGGRGGTVWLWDLNNRKIESVVPGNHEGGVYSIAFSPDGQILASGSGDGTIFIQVPTKILADMVCENVWRNLTMDEWQQFVSSDIPYERTCPNLPAGEGAPSETD